MRRAPHARRLPAVVAVVVLVLLTGCEVDATVDVRVHDDGSGTVTVRVALDADAVRRLETGGGELGRRVLVLDLIAAGWGTDGWTRVPDGGAELALRRDFATPGELPGLLAQLDGDRGVLRAEVERERSWLRSSDRLWLGVDLADPATGIAQDAELSAALAAAGVDVDALDQALLAELVAAFSLTVTAAVGDEDDTATIVSPRAGAAEVATASFATTRLVAAVGAAALALSGLVLAATAVVSARRARRAPGRHAPARRT